MMGGSALKVQGQNISMIRGDNESITVFCCNSDGNPIPFQNGDTVYLTVKSTTCTDKKLFQKVITQFTPDGKAVIAIDPEDTKALAFQTYVYDVQWTKSDGTVTTIIPPSGFIVGGEVTYE